MMNRLLQRFSLMALMLLLCAGFAQAGEVLIVADEWPQMDVLGAYLEEEGGFTVETAEPEALPEDLSPYEGIIQFVHGALGDEPAARMMNFTRNGGRLVVLHHGISSGKANTQGWLNFLGIKLDRANNSTKRYTWVHDVDITIVNLNPNHYITHNGVEYEETATYHSSDRPSEPVRGLALTFNNSEAFLNHQFTDGRAKTVLFGLLYQDPNTRAVYQQDRAGWLKRVGSGYVFYFQPGHITADFEKDAYCQIIQNCFTWQPHAASVE